MQIELQKAGKKYYREWIFRGLSLTLNASGKVAVLGPNGSGKSTLLQMLSGAVVPTEGTVSYSHGHTRIEPEMVYKLISFAAPYLELTEEMTFREMVRFHFRFKNMPAGLNEEKIISISGLSGSSGKQIKNFSSGMKQRAKLSLALLADTPLVFLDEPCSNLDRNAIEWYQDLIAQYTTQKLVVVCSNSMPDEYSFCTSRVMITDWKPGIS